MNNLFYAEGKLTEEQFRKEIDGIELDEIEIEFLRRYYFDTSVWLDFFEQRDEPNLPKEELACKLIEKIIREDCLIICSEVY